MYQPIRGHGDHLGFPIGPKNTNWGRGSLNLASCHVLLNSFKRFQRRSRKWLSLSEPRVAILVFRSVQNYNLGRGHSVLASCQYLLNSVQRCKRRSRKSLSQSGARLAIFVFKMARKFLLPIKFRQIPFSGLREEVEMWKLNDDGRQTDGGMKDGQTYNAWSQ